MPKKLHENGPKYDPPQWVSDPKEVEARKTRQWRDDAGLGLHVAPYKPGEADLSGKKPKPKRYKTSEDEWIF